jgi:hypothetical protein
MASGRTSLAGVGKNPMLDLRLNQRALRTAINAFARRHGPAATDRAVRKIAFNGDAAGYMHPKRIDTGRYRAAWNVAIEAAVGKAAGPKTITPPRNADGSRKHDSAGRFLKGEEVGPANGTARWSGRGLARTVTVINNVEYGPDVEYGTMYMIPGLHLTRGLLVATKDALKVVGLELRAAWDG